MGDIAEHYDGSHSPKDAVRTRDQLFGWGAAEKKAFDWMVGTIQKKKGFDLDDSIQFALDHELMFYGSKGEIRVDQDADVSVLEEL